MELEWTVFSDSGAASSGVNFVGLCKLQSTGRLLVWVSQSRKVRRKLSAGHQKFKTERERERENQWSGRILGITGWDATVVFASPAGYMLTSFNFSLLAALCVGQRLCIDFFVPRAGFLNHFAFTFGRYLFLLCQVDANYIQLTIVLMVIVIDLLF